MMMDLSEMGKIHIFQLPIDTAMLKSIREQLWTSIDRSPDIQHLMTADLIQCKRIDTQNLTYLSALPHQLLTGNTQSFSSVQMLGNHLLKHLVATNYDEPTTQWQGTANEQGYLYLQPSDEAIVTWLNQLLSTINPKINSYLPPTSTPAPVTLQYIYTRCHQLLQTNKAEVLPLSVAEITDRLTKEMKLIGAILDIWDNALTDTSSINTNNHRILPLSHQLLKQFLEFEKYCLLSAKNHQSSKKFNLGLIDIVQTTTKIILQQYWEVDPLTYW